ncbi:MAG: endonuclease III [Candidatus Aenigmarchaeota archaeon]|nr:endonuclease III [Candidatus Aenigmarchaeota archaeon]
MLNILEKRYDYWEKKKDDPFRVLIRTVLSQRTKDEVTDKAAERLFSKADTPDKLLSLSVREIENLIKPVGFYKVKARRIKEISKILIEKYNGKVPISRDEMLLLPGVGKKTVDCVLAFSFDKPMIAVDVHVAIISRRLGITNSNDYDQIQEDLFKITPKNKRKLVNFLLVEFGKEICRTQKPKCEICPVREWCKYYKGLNKKISMN